MKPPRIKKNIEETEIANESAKKIPRYKCDRSYYTSNNDFVTSPTL